MLYPLLTGGEPFLREDFTEIMSGMQEMGLQVSINSNGSLIDRSTAKWLGAHAPTRLNLTLYGASEESYQKVCGNGAFFGKVRDAVQWLRESDVPLKFNASITQDNAGDIQAMIAYAHSMDCPIQIATYMFPPVRRNDQMIGRNHRLSPEEAGRAKVEEMWQQGNREFFGGMAEMYQRFVPLQELENGPDLKPQKMEMICRAGVSTFWLDWEGNMSNCGMYPSVEFPMSGRTVREGWKKLVEETGKIRYRSVCGSCPNFKICHTCIAAVRCECGTEDVRPEYLCRYNQSAAYWYQEYVHRYMDGTWPHAKVDPYMQSDLCEL